MKALVLVALFASGCEHDPRYEHHEAKREAPAPAVDATPPAPSAPVVERTIERPALSPKVVPLKQRVHRHHHH